MRYAALRTRRITKVDRVPSRSKAERNGRNVHGKSAEEKLRPSRFTFASIAFCFKPRRG